MAPYVYECYVNHLLNVSRSVDRMGLCWEDGVYGGEPPPFSSISTIIFSKLHYQSINSCSYTCIYIKFLYFLATMHRHPIYLTLHLLFNSTSLRDLRNQHICPDEVCFHDSYSTASTDIGSIQHMLI